MKALIDAYKLMSVGFIVMLFAVQSNLIASVGVTGFVGAIITMFVLVICICMAQNESLANILFVGFAGITGLVLNPVIFSSKMPLDVVWIALVLTAVMFITLTAYALLSGKDFSGIGGFLTTALVVMIAVGIINIFVGSSIVELLLAGIGVIVFSGFILYDTQQIVENGHNYTTAMNALSMFLNIVNLFLDLLKIVLAILGDD